MSIIEVEHVEEAVRVAKGLKNSGHRYWFRGQSKNLPVRSTLVRLKSEDREIAMGKVKRYVGWIKSTPGLEYLARNTDATIAVAQHYGIQTNFIDFTTEREIAAFFASENASSATGKELACIIYVDIDDLKRFQQLAPKLEFLELDVPDLWRLQAQHGCFLFCPYDNIERLYDFDRILFPNSHQFHGITQEEVYPERKSHLEMLLDQFFLNERLLENTPLLLKQNGVRILKLNRSDKKYNPEIFPNGIPKHPSWSDDYLKLWLEISPESFDKVRTAMDYRIRVQEPWNKAHVIKGVAYQLMKDFFTYPGIRSKLVRWSIEIIGDHDMPKDFSSLLAPRLARLWDGLRRLPYSDEDISIGLGVCIALAISLKGDLRNPNVDYWDQAAEQCLANPIWLEFGANDGSYSRGYASSGSLLNAIRSDILSYVPDKLRKDLANEAQAILLSTWNPRNTFDFKLLAIPFCREIAPSQVLARDDVIFYSPARLISFGLP